MRVICTVDTQYFTIGKVYDVTRVDHDGDFWTVDDMGDMMFLFPDECEVVNEG